MMSAFCSRTKPTHSYYVTMVDYGNKGCEAIVDPEITYSGVVSRVRSGEYKDIIFVHHIAGEGASRTPIPLIVDDAGSVIGHVSYNGRVWAGPSYVADATPLFDNRAAA